MNWQTPALVLAAAGLLAAGCGPSPEPDTAHDAAKGSGQGNAPAPAASATQKEDTASPTTGSINIDDRILKTCGNLPTPRFAFDSSSIHGEAADVLRKVAQCFSEGPLKGRELKLVGRADPRGTEMYNIALGQERAASVGRFLEGAGVSKDKVRTMSKGAVDATGTDDEGWARDRRVDILLAD